jgi:hypothetical protein
MLMPRLLYAFFPLPPPLSFAFFALKIGPSRFLSSVSVSVSGRYHGSGSHVSQNKQ